MRCVPDINIHWQITVCNYHQHCLLAGQNVFLQMDFIWVSRRLAATGRIQYQSRVTLRWSHLKNPSAYTGIRPPNTHTNISSVGDISRNPVSCNWNRPTEASGSDWFSLGDLRRNVAVPWNGNSAPRLASGIELMRTHRSDITTGRAWGRLA